MHYIPYFIHEDIYLVKEENIIVPPARGQETRPASVKEDTRDVVLPYEGKNLKKILVLTSNHQVAFLAGHEKTFLGKILGALHFTFEDIAIVNAAKLNDGMAARINQFDCRYVISFGVMHDGLPISNKTAFYEIIKQGEVTLLLADPLGAIEGDERKKRQLWNVLKQLFSV